MATKRHKTREITEFGDFQTPPELAAEVTRLLARTLGIRPRSIVEPTCGRGAFVAAAAGDFPQAERIIGVEINPGHLEAARSILETAPSGQIELQQGDFFKVDWAEVIQKTRAPWLILGNPPWVTSSSLGALDSDNLPGKSNVHGHSGIEAITGKSNFDISEWMLLRYLEWLEGSSGAIAVLCKTAVARKVVLHGWKKKLPLRSAKIYRIDALRHFGAAVDACLFVLEIQPGTHEQIAYMFDSLTADQPARALGFYEGHLVTDIEAFQRQRHLLGPDEHYTWRSGIKHDCSKIMELAITAAGYRNGLGEQVVIEETLLFPMLKSSDIGNGRRQCRSKMLVTQRTIGEETAYIQSLAPQTWNYLTRHAGLFEKRGSSIYRKKPPFSIFGVGAYSFAPWKVAISGFYKKLQFTRIGSLESRPVVFDDTVYFLPCWSEAEACFLEELLLSPAALEFFNSMISWEDKRPITVDVLKRLNIRKLAASLGKEETYLKFVGENHPGRPHAVPRKQRGDDPANAHPELVEAL